MFPSLFEGLENKHLHCDVCDFAKHKRVSFTISNKRSSVLFYLIHSDVLGPSNILNILGSRWFLLFVNDCTRISCFFLLKSKSEISDVFQKFS